MKYVYAILSPLVSIVFYLAIGGGVYIWAYGEPTAITMKLFVVMVAWPAALVWWSLWWIGVMTIIGITILGLVLAAARLPVSFGAKLARIVKGFKREMAKLDEEMAKLDEE